MKLVNSLQSFSFIILSTYKSVFTVGPTKYLSFSKITFHSMKFLRVSRFLSVNQIKSKICRYNSEYHVLYSISVQGTLFNNDGSGPQFAYLQKYLCVATATPSALNRVCRTLWAPEFIGGTSTADNILWQINFSIFQ